MMNYMGQEMEKTWEILTLGMTESTLCQYGEEDIIEDILERKKAKAKNTFVEVVIVFYVRSDKDQFKWGWKEGGKYKKSD